MSPAAMTEEIKEKQREYKREWNRKNKDKVKEHQQRYWLKKLQQSEGV